MKASRVAIAAVVMVGGIVAAASAATSGLPPRNPLGPTPQVSGSVSVWECSNNPSDGLPSCGDGQIIGVYRHPSPSPPPDAFVLDTPTALPSIVVLDPPLNTMTFVPPGDVQARLTSSEAIAAFRAADPEFTGLPADATSFFGIYTAAVGDGTFRFHDRLAWGYTWHRCVQSQAPFASAPTPAFCKQWLFLDANTGQMLEATWQKGA